MNHQTRGPALRVGETTVSFAEVVLVRAASSLLACEGVCAEAEHTDRSTCRDPSIAGASAWGHPMAKRNNSGTVMVATDLGFHALVFDEHDVARLLRAAVERAGGQSAFAKHHGVDRAYLNMVLNGRRPVSDSIARALGLHKVYVARSRRRTGRKRQARPLPP
jgi:hypothetical protein